MKVTVIQTQLVWENINENLKHFEELISNIKDQTELIILPEMFTTGFSMKPEMFPEEQTRRTLQWLTRQSALKNTTITGSIAYNENGLFYNRLLWVKPNGEILHYNKRHLFSMAGEEKHYVPGTEKIYPKINDWKICPLICYDLRFPVWSRNKFNKSNSKGDYDVLIYIANWPSVRNHAWKQLLIARAIENQCYVIGVNRIGEDGNGHAHSGDSAVINPRGEIVSNIEAEKEQIETIQLDKNYLDEFRKNFPVGMDSDDFKIV
jgi:omega-amidase